MVRTIQIAVILFALWLLMSGVYTGLIISLGAISSLGAALIAHRMSKGYVEESTSSHHARVSGAAVLAYLPWLIVEVLKADWAIVKMLISPKMNINQRLIKVPVEQQSDVGKVLFANSITLTPGTLTVETEADHFLVHAISDEAADMDALTGMGHRVALLEAEGQK